MATMTTGIKYNAFENTITMSAAFAKRAQKYGSPEYKELVKYMSQNPGATTTVEEKRTATKKLTIKEMKAYIALLPNADELMKQLEAVQKVASIRSAMPYTEIAHWFEKNCPVIRNENGTLNVEKMLNAVAEANTPNQNVVPFEKKAS